MVVHGKALQMAGDVPMQEHPGLRVNLTMTGPFNISQFVVLMPSGVIVGIGNQTWERGLPQSLALSTAMLVGTDQYAAGSNEHKLQIPVALFVPNMPLMSWVYRGTLPHLSIVHAIEVFYQGSLGPLKAFLASTSLRGLFVHVSQMPFTLGCEICACEPAVDLCPGPVIFPTGIVFQVEKFCLFGIICGGFTFQAVHQDQPPNFELNMSAWLEPFALGPFNISGYLDPHFGHVAHGPTRTYLQASEVLESDRTGAQVQASDESGSSSVWDEGDTGSVGLAQRLLQQQAAAHEQESASVRKEGDCKVNPWSPWSKCTHKCGSGLQRRARKVVKAALQGGQPCPPHEELYEAKACNTKPCGDQCG